MVTFLSVILFIVCVVLILMVLIQDPKGGGAMGMLGGGGSNTLWGASGAATFLEKVTRTTAILFFVLTFALAWQVGKRNKSVTEDMTIPAAATDSLAPTTPESEAQTPDQGTANSPAPSTSPAEKP